MPATLSARSDTSCRASGLRAHHVGRRPQVVRRALAPTGDLTVPVAGPLLEVVLGEGLQRRARADQVAVAVRLVDPADRAEVLTPDQALHRVDRGGAGVGPRPLPR